jgi:CRISPR type III-B/RAMP module RAMP protein Cmr1
MITRKYSCELLTPIIMSGADQTKAELRATSIKGMLRWWWRALSKNDDIEELRRKESHIFGGVSEANPIKSKVSLWVRWLEDPIIIPIGKYVKSAPSLKYLTYGAGVDDSNPERPAFKSGQTFEIYLRYPQILAEEIAPAVSCMLTYGGFGLKSRNGFGQVFCSEISQADLPERKDSSKFNSKYAHLGNFEHFKMKAFQEQERAHLMIADAYYDAKKSKRGEENHRTTFTTDGDRNLFAAHTPKQFQFETSPGIFKDFDRIAKPLQIYVKKQGNGQYVPGIIAFPYDFTIGKTNSVNPPMGRNPLTTPTGSHAEIVRLFMHNLRKNEAHK